MRHVALGNDAMLSNTMVTNNYDLNSADDIINLVPWSYVKHTNDIR